MQARTGLALVLLLAGSGAAAAQTADLVLRTELRVCADPRNLPFSNQAGEGFENKVAAIVAADLGLPLSYVWFPQVIGFVRNTLSQHQCDLVMGTVSGDGLMDNTNPYYHSGYMIVSRADAGIDATELGDPALSGKRIGLIAATPPTDLALRHGLMGQVTSYALAVDTRFDSPARSMIQDILDGKLDVGLLWGPIAGYYRRHEGLPLKTAFLGNDGGAVRLDFHIAMGVRANELDWRRRLNEAIRRHQAEIARVLADYGVPQLDEQGRPVAAVAEPAGYRLDDYRAPVPDTVAGGHVLRTAALKALVQRGGAVLIDVLPAPRRPEGMRPGAPWLPEPRLDIPGSLWLPEVGRGEIGPDLDAWFRAAVERATGGDRGRPLVFYCLADCWMSWNAAKRAASYGYRDVGWYPDGTDGWAAAGQPLAAATPEPFESAR